MSLLLSYRGINLKTKAEMKKLINLAIREKKLVNLHFRFDKNYYNAIPLVANDKLCLFANENDFILDGYSIFRFKDLIKVNIKNDKCDEILKNEGILNGLTTPDVDISLWKTALESLKSMKQYIIIEIQSLNEDEQEFALGRIEHLYKNFAYIREFDADGIYQEELYRISYSHITNITFASRYIEIFSKYLSE
jgi:hypothetical protein